MSTVTMRVRLKLPIMPNYLHVESFIPDSMDSAQGPGVKVDVGELDAEAIKAFCENWTKEFTEHAQRRRAACGKA